MEKQYITGIIFLLSGCVVSYVQLRKSKDLLIGPGSRRYIFSEIFFVGYAIIFCNIFQLFDHSKTTSGFLLDLIGIVPMFIGMTIVPHAIMYLLLKVWRRIREEKN